MKIISLALKYSLALEQVLQFAKQLLLVYFHGVMTFVEL